jgi:hypothetical protein
MDRGVRLSSRIRVALIGRSGASSEFGMVKNVTADGKIEPSGDLAALFAVSPGSVSGRMPRDLLPQQRVADLPQALQYNAIFL